MFGDIYTTAINNDGSGGSVELTKRYRLPNGDANIRLLVIDKLIIFGICAAVTAAMYFSGWDFTPFSRSIAFVLFLLVGVIHLIPTFKNWKVYQKFKAKGKP